MSAHQSIPPVSLFQVLISEVWHSNLIHSNTNSIISSWISYCELSLSPVNTLLLSPPLPLSLTCEHSLPISLTWTLSPSLWPVNTLPIALTCEHSTAVSHLWAFSLSIVNTLPFSPSPSPVNTLSLSLTCEHSLNLSYLWTLSPSLSPVNTPSLSPVNTLSLNLSLSPVNTLSPDLSHLWTLSRREPAGLPRHGTCCRGSRQTPWPSATCGSIPSPPPAFAAVLCVSVVPIRGRSSSPDAAAGYSSSSQSVCVCVCLLGCESPWVCISVCVFLSLIGVRNRTEAFLWI